MPHPQLAVVELAMAKDVYHNQLTDGFLNRMAEHALKMKKVADLIGLITEHTEDKKWVDFNADPVGIKMVDDVREFCDLIPHGCYKWKEGQLDNLVSGLNQHVNLVLAPSKQQEQTLLTNEKYEYSKIFDVLMHIQKQCHYQIQRFNSNMQKKST